jgi:TetR/AcrR family transcriptional regulator
VEEKIMKKAKQINIETLIEESTRYEQTLSEKEKSILTAAENLFAEKGASDTPTAEIAKKAGVTERTLFRYFPTKNDLLKRVMFPVLLKTLIPLQINKMKSLLKNSDLGVEQMLVKIFQDRLDVAKENKGKIRFMLNEILKSSDLRKQIIDLWEKEVWIEAVATIDSLQKSGQIRKDLNSGTVTRTVFSVIMAYVLAKHVIGFSPKWNDHEEIEQILDILLNGIKG